MFLGFSNYELQFSKEEKDLQSPKLSEQRRSENVISIKNSNFVIPNKSTLFS